MLQRLNRESLYSINWKNVECGCIIQVETSIKGLG
ncbi:hypothetical protein CCH01_00310 [Clostridium chauvoei JF4335]|uniref:Uncharacterized protein n=1 Tax=Clostridium chauvoei JF4335 TaxID=1351755 RepID=A0A1U6IQ62_9CLOT|nr:hypothetical protein CCH01_00310 [Clostridium chauvoei JF4335]